MELTPEYVKDVLGGKRPPIEITFRTPLGIEYGLEFLERDGEFHVLKYKGRRLGVMETPLTVMINGIHDGTYEMSSIALTMDEFKQRVEKEQEKALKILKESLKMKYVDFLAGLRGVEDAPDTLEQFAARMYSPEWVENVRLQGDTVAVFVPARGSDSGRNLYSNISNIAHDTFYRKAGEIKEYIRTSKPRRR